MRTTAPGVCAAGDGIGVEGSRVAVDEGRLAAIGAALDLGALSLPAARAAAAPVRRRLARARAFGRALEPMHRIGPGIFELLTPETTVCRCEQVSARQLAEAIDHSADINVIKMLTPRRDGDVPGPQLPAPDRRAALGRARHAGRRDRALHRAAARTARAAGRDRPRLRHRSGALSVTVELPTWPALGPLTAPLPARTDVLVIGGGIAGVLVARGLAAAGTDVVLVERGELNREASGGNAGSIHLQIAIHQLTGPDTSDAVERLTEESRQAARAAELWRGMDDASGGRIHYHETGGVMIADDEVQLRLLREKHALEQAAGLETHVLEGAELRAVAPYLSPAVRGVTYCPREGHVDPLAAVPLLAADAVARGAQIRVHAAVTAITATGAAGGGPFRVQTTAGPVEARRIVNAAGAWAGSVAELTGTSLPMVRNALHVNVTEARPPMVAHFVQHIARRLTLKQTSVGTIIIGGGWPAHGALDDRRPTTTWDSAAGNAAVAVDVIPSLAGVRLVRTWSAEIAWMHDVSPLLGDSARVPGLSTIVVASSGYTMTPVFAEMLVSHLTTGAVLPAAYSPDRTPTSPLINA